MKQVTELTEGIKDLENVSKYGQSYADQLILIYITLCALVAHKKVFDEYSFNIELNDERLSNIVITNLINSLETNFLLKANEGYENSSEEVQEILKDLIPEESKEIIDICCLLDIKLNSDQKREFWYHLYMEATKIVASTFIKAKDKWIRSAWISKYLSFAVSKDLSKVSSFPNIEFEVSADNNFPIITHPQFPGLENRNHIYIKPKGAIFDLKQSIFIDIKKAIDSKSFNFDKVYNNINILKSYLQSDNQQFSLDMLPNRDQIGLSFPFKYIFKILQNTFTIVDMHMPHYMASFLPNDPQNRIFVFDYFGPRFFLPVFQSYSDVMDYVRNQNLPFKSERANPSQSVIISELDYLAKNLNNLENHKSVLSNTQSFINVAGVLGITLTAYMLTSDGTRQETINDFLKLIIPEVGFLIIGNIVIQMKKKKSN